MAEMQRTAEAVWRGDSRAGSGSFSTGSGAIRELPYTWRMRFTEEVGANPEELIAAAHASCFSMALASQLKKAGFTAEELHTRAILTMEQGDAGWGVTRIRLEVEGVVPGADEAAFQQSAESAKATCPISRLLAPGLQEIELKAILKG